MVKSENEDLNPWSIQSVYDLQYFLCPTCQFKDHSKQTFVFHAYEKHPQIVEQLRNVTDHSLNDVECPWLYSNDQKLENGDHDDDHYDTFEDKVNIKLEVSETFGDISTNDKTESFEDEALFFNNEEEYFSQSDEDNAEDDPDFNHNDDIDDVKDQELFQCDQCEKSFKNQDYHYG